MLATFSWRDVCITSMSGWQSLFMSNTFRSAASSTKSMPVVTSCVVSVEFLPNRVIN